MTPEEHNKYLGWAHLAHGGFQLLIMLAFVAFFLFIITSLPPGGGAPDLAFFLIIMTFVAFFQLLFVLPAFIAGYGLLKRKRWAKTMSIIAGVLAAMNFPVGTAVCVYSLWFMLGEGGKGLYDKVGARPRASLSGAPPPPPDWASARQPSEREYVPPAQPPNWRE